MAATTRDIVQDYKKSLQSVRAIKHWVNREGLAHFYLHAIDIRSRDGPRLLR